MSGSSASALGFEAQARTNALAGVWRSALDFWTLTKPEVNFLIVMAAFTGFYLGAPVGLTPFPFGRLFRTLCGTLLVASGAGTLNQYVEYRFDAQMRRTRRRPIASGRLRPATAAWFGATLSAIGTVYLFVGVSALASLLALITLTTYLVAYTPLKRTTPLCTFVGAIPGAMPTLIGWAAVSGSVNSLKAWILYALLFFWQFPHFMAIARMYRDDYARAGYLILPSEDESCFLAGVTLIPSGALFVVGIVAVAANGGRTLQYIATGILGFALFYFASRLVVLRTGIAARLLLKATVLYLPLQFLILVLGKN